MEKLLNDKVAIITGGAGGLGRAIAEAFAREGAKIVLVSRNEEKLAEVAKTLDSAGASGVLACASDLTSPSAAAEVTQKTLGAFGKVDILVNCAGVFIWKKFLDAAPEDWSATLATNLSAPFYMGQAVARAMTEGSYGGSIINITSIHGTVGDGTVVHHCASKFGLEGLTLSMAEALRSSGIRVNSIGPGSIEPDSGSKTSDNLNQKITQGDIAQTAIFLASDRASGITGAQLSAYGVTRPVIASPK